MAFPLSASGSVRLEGPGALEPGAVLLQVGESVEDCGGVITSQASEKLTFSVRSLRNSPFGVSVWNVLSGIDGGTLRISKRAEAPVLHYEIRFIGSLAIVTGMVLLLFGPFVWLKFPLPVAGRAAILVAIWLLLFGANFGLSADRFSRFIEKECREATQAGREVG